MCAPACISVTALRRACSFDSWYAPNGKSLISQATPCARRRPLATQSVWWRIVSSVTPTVLDKPWHTMPKESPTRMHSTPAASATAANVAS